MLFAAAMCRRILRSRTILALGPVIATACSGDAPTNTTPTPPVAATGRIVLSAPSTSVGLGDVVATAVAIYEPGDLLIAGATPLYSLSDSTRARITLDGRVTAIATGTVDVIARYRNYPEGRLRLTLTAGTGAWGAGALLAAANNESGESIVTDPAGNVYVAGSTGNGTGGSDAFVTRFLPNGKVAWTQLIPTFAFDGANGIARHKDGGVVVNSSTVVGSQVTYVDASGRIVWQRELLSAGFNDVATDAAGNVYVAGNSIRSNAGSACPGVPLPAPNSITTGGAGDGMLIKYSASGSLLWCRVWTHVHFDQPEPRIPVFDTQGVSLAIDESRGAIYVGGAVQLNTLYGLIPYVRRMSLADGTTAWMKFVVPGGVSDSIVGRPLNSQTAGVALLHGLTVDGAGDVWAAMQEDSLQNSAWRYHAYVAKLSPDGVPRLRREIALPDAERSRAATAITYRASANDVVVVNAYDDTFLRRGNYPNGTVVALDLAGTEKWRSVIVGTPITPGQVFTTSVRAVTAASNGDVFVTGDTPGNFLGFINGAVAAGRAGTDTFVARLSGRP